MTRRLTVALGAVLLLWAPSSRAQTTEDEQTRDHELEEQRYYQRYLQEEEKKEQSEEATPAPPDPGAEREAYLARADELIRDLKFKAADSVHYDVKTDDPRLNPKSAGALLESFHAFFEEFWVERAELRPYEEKVPVYLFFSFYKFNQLLAGDWRFHPNRPKGHYQGRFDVINLHTDPGGVDSLSDALLHESAHQLCDQRLFVEQYGQPLWLAEGMASYFGYTLKDDAGFHPGRIGGKGVALLGKAGAKSGEEPKALLQEMKAALRESKSQDVPIFWRTLTIEDPSVFYGQSAQVNYGASWVVIHFLFHADEGAHAQAFRRYIDLVNEGRGEAEALLQELGMTRDELEAAVTAYFKRLKAR